MAFNKSFSAIRARLIAVLFITLPLLASAAAGADYASGQAEGRFYPQTGYTLAPEFVGFYDANGGLPIFGYPIGPAYNEGGYLVQWTERERLEYHPENVGTPYEVLLGLLGRELTAGYDGPTFQAQPFVNTQQLAGGNDAPIGGSDPQAFLPGQEAAQYFPQTGQEISGLFLDFWQRNGGLMLFGYPISSVFSDDSGLQIQWFERARFEYHPELSSPNKVLLGQLGHEALAERSANSYTLQVFDQPAPDSNLEIGLSQGGESEDPGFFDNIRATGGALGPGLVRLDNIYNFYHVVSRNPDGSLKFSWNELDAEIDSVRAMGKEPLLCLSYMPELMSVNGDSRVMRPANYNDWAALVQATVQHLNVERKLGIKYFEVWNEPDQWSFWQDSFDNYLQLYDVTAQAITSVDPTARVGGPAVSRFSPEHLQAFLSHEAALGPQARVDFVSWHAYGQSPEELAAQIRQARALVAQYPQFNPELFITEFNVSQGGSGDTSANGRTDTAEGAIALLAAIESMQRERLDRAFLFELKDGLGPKDYWGRWGILTNNGQPKPIYWALKAYVDRPAGMLPVQGVQAPDDGSLGLMAFGSPQQATLFLWYTGDTPARIKVGLPSSFAQTTFDITLFDKDHNNPARTGDPQLQVWAQRNAGDLVVPLQPNSLAIFTSAAGNR